MKIELRNVKHSAFASEETECFEASIYIDGKKTGTVVSNSGHGGCNSYYGGDAEKRITEYAKTLPAIVVPDMELDGKPFSYQPDADSIISEILSEYLTQRELKRLCARMVCFRKPGESYSEGEYSTLKCKFSPAAKDQLVRKYGEGVFILNEAIANG